MDLTVDKENLKKASARGVAINLVSQTLRLVLQFSYQVLLSRALVPLDFGIVAIAGPVLAFVGLFGDLGLTQATVQREHLTHDHLNFIFWVNFLLSATLSMITVGAAPLIAAFYGDARIAPVVMALGTNFVIAGLYSQHLALLSRKMSFAKLAFIDLVSMALGCTAGLTGAFWHIAYWAIVINQLATSIAALLLSWAIVRWIPGLPRWHHDGRALIGFGADVTGFNLANYFARNLDNVLIGKYAGEQSLGLYDRAYKLLLLPLNQVTGPFAKVAIPLLSSLQSDPVAYRSAYLRILEAVMLLTYPAVAFAMVGNERLIRLTLGSNWSGVSPIFAVLVVGGFFAPIGNSTGWLFITQARTAEMRNWGIVSAFMFVLAFVAGLPWGALGVASCYIAVGALIQGPMVCWAATRMGPVSLAALITGMLPFVFALLITFAVEVAAQRLMTDDIKRLVWQAFIAYPSFLLGLCVTSSGRHGLGGLVRHLRLLKQRGFA